ncbi:hypothetical protein T552_02387 [Pneumocystis carinii B80]|uniref:Uncharacterized protein n=1 Tax=Pneumocystis carinii (strain B80) TaxID=1408658 RepID=A0A0W4ZGA3_PNEC8|nr:hypothetical protein T552_02387 [Pneumocystis carinii B80]KTW27408.1 hypothetical protein T552_02387 [Pneumocystis carinii B80]
MRSTSIYGAASLLCFLFLSLNRLIIPVNGVILAIDYGKEWIKGAIINHGIPIEIVLTRESKRKDQSVIGFNGDERVYGTYAADLLFRNQSLVFPSLKSLIGKPYDSREVREYMSLYRNIELIPSNNGSGVAFVHNDRTFTVEELTAMIFENYKNMAEDVVGEKITDVVITVPSFFTEIERHAVLDAAEIAGLKVISLVNEGYAIAINYAMTRIFSNESQYHIFYDMGAGSTTATYVSFKTLTLLNNKTLTLLKVIGVGYNRYFGGDTITWKLLEYLIQEFELSKRPLMKDSIRSNPKAITKLFHESSRIKQILSINSEAHLMIENLHEGIDYSIKVSREIFEGLLRGLVDDIKKPITDAVSMTSKPIRFVNSVVLAGGGARVPFVQKEIEALVGSKKVARSVNADEAAVLGAVFRGAGLSGQFRVKNIKSTDITMNSVFISYPDLHDSSKVVTHSLFLKGMELNKDKTVNFALLSEFNIIFSHVVGFRLPGTEFATVKISGFNDSVDYLKNQHDNQSYCENLATSVTFRLNFSGLITVKSAFVECRSKVMSTLNFYEKSHKEYERKLFEEYNYVEYYDSLESNDDDDDDDDDKLKRKNTTRPLDFEISYTNLNPQDKNFKMASRNMLLNLKEIDKKRAARDEARNLLEAYIYNVQELLEIDEFIAVSNQEQREELSNVVKSVSEWLEKNGDVSTLEELTERKNIIKALESPISERRVDARERSFRIDELRRRIDGFMRFLNSLPIEKIREPLDDSDGDKKIPYKKILDEAGFGSGMKETMRDVEEPGFRPEDVEAYRTNAIKVEKWLDESITAQDALKPWENPVLKVKDIMSKIWELEQTKENIRVMEQIYLRSREYFKKNAEKERQSVNESNPSVSIEQNSTNATMELPVNTTLAESVIYTDI